MKTSKALTTIQNASCVLLALYWLITTSAAFSLKASVDNAPKHRIQVCQNKDCCRRFRHSSTSLVECLQDLVPPGIASIEVEQTGCFSNCDKGPNVVVETDGEKAVTFSGIETPAAVVTTLLAEACEIDVPSKLIAAVTVMEKAQNAKRNVKGGALLLSLQTSGKEPLDLLHVTDHLHLLGPKEERERFLTSVIQSLERDDDLQESSATMRAYTLRAELRFDSKEYQSALGDAKKAIEIAPTVPPVAAFRVAVDASRTVGEFDGAVRYLEQWISQYPSFQRKLAPEIQALAMKLRV